MVGHFRAYCVKAGQHFVPLTKVQEAAITLLAKLRETKASLKTYESMMEWHLKVTGALRPHETFKNAGENYWTRQKLFTFLRKRYNMDEMYYGVVKPLTLPFARAKVQIVTNNAWACVQSLFTDPRIKDEHYMFFDNDPFAPPPDDLDYILDLNTGLCYRCTHKALIQDPTREVLWPVPIYIDGCATGQFANLPITKVKIGHGLLNRKARDNAWAWRTIGFLPAHSKFRSLGSRMLVESGHVDGVMVEENMSDDEGNLNGITAKKDKIFMPCWP